MEEVPQTKAVEKGKAVVEETGDPVVEADDRVDRGQAGQEQGQRQGQKLQRQGVLDKHLGPVRVLVSLS